MKWYEYVVLIFGSGLIGAVIQICVSNYYTVRMAMLEKQKEVYNDFLLQLQTIASPSKNDNTFQLVVVRNKVLLYAGHKTAQICNNYVNRLSNSKNEPLSKAEHDLYYANMIHSMRKDLKLGKKYIKNIQFIVTNAPQEKKN